MRYTMLKKIKCIVSYDGSLFSGYQIQPKKRTVHGELEKALTKMHKGSSIRVHASGRTDTGVHAIGQTIHFETHYDLTPTDWKNALNTLLPNDIYIQTAIEAPAHFHARYDVVEKEYRYVVRNEREPNVFKRNYAYHFPYPLDMEAVHAACRLFEGTHDFTTFSSAKATVKGSKERTLYEASCQQEGEELTFTFRGSGYLYNMVRIMVGTILDIGQGKRQVADIPMLFEKRDRRLASATAPAQGLYLWNVTYKDELKADKIGK